MRRNFFFTILRLLLQRCHQTGPNCICIDHFPVISHLRFPASTYEAMCHDHCVSPCCILHFMKRPSMKTSEPCPISCSYPPPTPSCTSRFLCFPRWLPWALGISGDSFGLFSWTIWHSVVLDSSRTGISSFPLSLSSLPHCDFLLIFTMLFAVLLRFSFSSSCIVLCPLLHIGSSLGKLRREPLARPWCLSSIDASVVCGQFTYFQHRRRPCRLPVSMHVPAHTFRMYSSAGKRIRFPHIRPRK